MSGRAAELAAISALALAITIALAVPVLQAPSERVFGMETAGRHHDPFTAMEQFGRPLTLGVYAQPLTDLTGALLARAAGPVAAYNWLVLLTFPLSAAAAYLLARHFPLSPAGAALAALAFAFSPFHLAQAAYHPHIAQTQWIPLYLLGLWRCLDRPTPAAIGLLGLSTVAVTLSNLYGGLIAAATTPVAIAAYWFFRSRHAPLSTRRLAITGGSLLMIAGAGLAYTWYAAQAVVLNPAAFAYPRADLFRYSAKWWSYLVPPLANPVLGHTVERGWIAAGVREGLLEQQVSLGWGVVALRLVALVAWVVRDRQVRSVAAVPVLAAVAVVALMCSLSPERAIGSFTFTRPSAVLYGVLPMFRSYARFGVVVQLMAAMLAGIGAERLWRAGTLARIASVSLVILAAAEYAVSPAAMWRDVLPTRAHRWVAQQAHDLRVLDCAPLTDESRSVPWLTAHRIALRPAAFDDCTQPNIADKLAAAGYTHLLVRRHSPDGQWFGTRKAPEGLEPVAHFHDGQVFAVTSGSPPVYTAQMTAFYPREHNDTWEWRWMGRRASWRVENRTERAIVAVLDIELTAFLRPRGLTILLDGTEVQTLIVEELRRYTSVGPFTLTPGVHDLTFQPIDPPSVADTFLANGDRRPLSFGVGAWHWRRAGMKP
jgi:hypothetical protein